jgi:hypothetical protein
LNSVLAAAILDVRKWEALAHVLLLRQRQLGKPGEVGVKEAEVGDEADDGTVEQGRSAKKKYKTLGMSELLIDVRVGARETVRISLNQVKAKGLTTIHLSLYTIVTQGIGMDIICKLHV